MVLPEAESRKVKRETCAGIFLIVAALTGVLVMAFHPTAQRMLQPGQLGRQAHLSGMVHGVASSIAILLWSAAIVKTGRMSRLLANMGFVVGGVLLLRGER